MDVDRCEYYGYLSGAYNMIRGWICLESTKYLRRSSIAQCPCLWTGPWSFCRRTHNTTTAPPAFRRSWFCSTISAESFLQSLCADGTQYVWKMEKISERNELESFLFSFTILNMSGFCFCSIGSLSNNSFPSTFRSPPLPQYLIGTIQ